MRKRALHISILILWSAVIGRAAEEPQRIEPGKPVEREIAGGHEHAYQIALIAGQFMRVVVEPKGIGLTASLTAPGGKRIKGVDLARSGAVESLSVEADATGDYRLTTRALGADTLNGSYVLRLEVRSPSVEDRQRIAAEQQMSEATSLIGQGATAQRAIEKLEPALSLWRRLGDRYFAARTLYLLGRAYSSLSREETALEQVQQALAIYQELKNLRGEGDALNHLGLVNNRLSRSEKAIEHLDQALRIARELKDPGDEAIVLNNLASAYRNLSWYEKAAETYEQAIRIARQTGDRQREGSVLGNLGNTYRNLGRYEKAIECLEQSLVIVRELKDGISEANGLSNLGIVYTVLNRYDKALQCYEQSLLIRRAVKDRTGEGISLHNIAIIYDETGQYEKAVEFYEQALVIAREVKRRVGEGNTLTNLGNVNRSLKRYEKAIEYYEKGLAIAREIKNRQGEGELLNNIGVAYRNLGRYDQAIEHSEQALRIARELKEQRDEATALSSLAESERDHGNLTSARNLMEECLHIIESLRSEIYNRESRTSYFATLRSYGELYIDLLMRLNKADHGGGFDALAFGASERARARGLLELLTEAGTDIRQGVDAALLERERSLAKQLNAKAAGQVQLLTRSHTPQQAEAVKQEISEIENSYQQVQAEIRRTSPRYAALTQPAPLSLKEIQQELDPDTLVLEYSLGDERSYLWAVTKNSMASHELPKLAEVDKASRQVYELLTSRGRSWANESPAKRNARLIQADARLAAAAQQLSQMILGPVSSQLSGRRLVIVADGPLQYIPFAMLPEPGVGGQGVGVGKNAAKNSQTLSRSPHPPLIVNHEVVSLPSASALAIQRAELADRTPAPKMLAVIADPVFDRADMRVNSPARKASQKDQAQALSFDDARSIEHLVEKSDDNSVATSSRLLIPRLSFTRQEATGLLALTAKDSSFSALDFKASRETVLSGALGQYRYVHFATHGVMDSERPGLSALVLSMVDEQGKPRDGFLRANDIYNLKAPAELVVLSACQTGLGKEIKGEGLIGLTRGFMYAGAARVVVSLWNVNDRATAELMTKFYEKMLKRGQRPAAALRAAQVEMWKQKEWQSPYYWAAFTMQGEWR